MSDDEFFYSDDECKKKGQEAANMFKARQERNITELDDTLSEFIEEWRIMRKKEDEDLARLKAKQAKRKVKRAEEEKKLREQKKQDEQRKAKEEAELKKKEEDERLRRLEEMEKKRQESVKKASDKKKMEGGDKLSSMQAARGEKGKTREQLAEEKKIAIMVRVAPLTGLENLNLQGLKEKADELFKKVIRMETEKYDMEQRRARQDYDLRELQTRMNVKLRAQALKKGLDPGALTGKHPPKIQVASKFERRADSRSYDDKKNLFEGGYEREVQDKIESQWQEKYNEFIDRNRSKLPKWFGERPGKGNQYDDDSDDYEDEDEDDSGDYDEPADESDETEDEDEEDEEEEEDESEEEESEEGSESESGEEEEEEEEE